MASHFAALFASLLLLIGPGAATSRPTAGQLNLHNDRWDAVRVELRVGAAQDCNSNGVVGVRTLRRGKVWAVVVDQVVCWRREASPGDPSGGWTLWASRSVLLNAVEDVSL